MIWYVSDNEFAATLEEAYAGKEKKDTNFTALFDSAATTHVVNNLTLLHDVVDSPESGLTSIVKGHGAVIRKRGNLWLNKEKGWLLRNVAYIPNATVNLISIGITCDASFAVVFVKERAIVRIRNEDGILGATVIEAERIGRLWVFSRENLKLGQKVGTGLAKSRRANRDEDDEKEEKSKVATESKKTTKLPANSENQEEAVKHSAKNTANKINQGGKGKASQQ